VFEPCNAQKVAIDFSFNSFTMNILITSGPTREYLDPVRYLTNGSSGRMGAALAEAVVQQGGVPIVVSGQVAVSYPLEAEVHWVETTEQMLQRCLNLFPHCAGVIGAAAPCDFKPVAFSEQKISKPKEEGITFQFTKTPDILAALGKIKRPNQWSVAYALETQDGPASALKKLKQKCSDFVVLDDPDSMNKDEASFQVFDVTGELRKLFTGTKRMFADELLRLVVKPR
jgi:phosphopantothenoylcysteine decarboxylase/phosphopantothenate--cysteine ligase